MYSRKVKCFLVAFAAPIAMLGSLSAFSQTITKQVLDRVEVVSPNTVLDMAFDDPAQNPQFSLPLGANVGNFTACQLTATQGLYCLDQNSLKQKGRLVRNWNPVAPSSDPPLFTCEDSALGFDTSKSVETCTGITVGGDGAVFVSGKTRNLYSLVKVVEVKVVEEASPGICPASSSYAYSRLSNEPGSKQFCYAQLPGWKDRPLLVDLTATKAVVSVTKPNGSVVRVQCSGVIGLEERKTLMFFPDPELNGTGSDCGAAPVTIATSKSWGLQGSEQLQSATVVQTKADDPLTPNVDETVTFALGATSGGLIKAKDTSTPTTIATTAFNIPQERSGRSTSFMPKATCSTTGQQYGIRTNAKSDAVYVTDRNCGEVLALGPTVSATGALLGLTNIVFNGDDQTLSTCLDPSTCSDSTGFYPALQPTLAPGDSIDLNDCGFDTSGNAKTCTIAKSEFGADAATLTKVNVVSTPSGLTLFQIQNMPDCRWLKKDKPTEYPVSICDPAIVGGENGKPWTQYLDVSKLLPKEVTDQFVRKPLNPNYPATSTNPLNPMLLSPAYRAQVRGIPAGVPVKDTEITGPVTPRYYFDAFFGITEAGVIFADTFDMTLEVESLAGGGTKLGCTPDGTTTYPSNTWPVPMSWLLQWDVSVRISENDLTVGGPSAPDLSYTDMLVNNGCGSGKNVSPSWSMFIFNLEMSEKEAPSELDVSDPNLDVPRELEIAFAQQVVGLFYKDLYDALKQTACSPVARAGSTVQQRAFDASTCNNVYKQWDGARDKLDKCIAGSDFPKTSEAVRNCQAFNSALNNLEASLRAVPACQKSQTQANPGSCGDQANRRGEMLGRVATLRDVFNNKFLPSVPSNGFVSLGYNTLYPLAPR